MRIKRIEIIGFKSFNDRAVLNISDPITAVVGPNGCGKSNIVDAIRWSMGEQSAKHLRGQSMGDVIFAGSETRGPAGMAEVSLTFDDVGISRSPMLANGDDGAVPHDGSHGDPPDGASRSAVIQGDPPDEASDGKPNDPPDSASENTDSQGDPPDEASDGKTG